MSKARTATRKPVGIWFAAFAATLVTMLVAAKLLDIQDPLIANGMVLFSMIFLVKAGLNAAANAASAGESGAAQRNYLRRMLAVSLTYVGSLFAASALIADGDPVTPLSVTVAIVPGLAVAGYFYAIGKYLFEQQDEFLRMLMVRQALVATGLAFSLASVWGFLESFGQVPHLDAFWWPIVWFFGLGLGAAANKLQYDSLGEC